MNIKAKKISPLLLGAALCCSQVLQQPIVRAASLSATSPENLSSLTPSVPLVNPAAAAPGGCALNPLKDQKGAVPSASHYQSSVPGTANPAVGAAPSAMQPIIVSQLIPDENCCELGGTADCEVGGIPPAGGALAGGGGFPLAALLGLLPLAGLGFIGGGGGNGGNGDNGTPPPPLVPESSSTAGLAAGLGLLGIWYSRRLRVAQRSSSLK